MSDADDHAQELIGFLRRLAVDPDPLAGELMYLKPPDARLIIDALELMLDIDRQPGDHQ